MKGFMEYTISVMDLIQITLLLGACFACYVKGKIEGIDLVLNDLLDRDKIKLEDVTDLLD
jgi:hypothetical protein